MTPQVFQNAVLGWFDRHGRKDLPWQQNITPYRVWLSEIMLQQTQVSTVIPYFHRFSETLPTVDDLAKAKLDDVLGLWSGLGYYARACHLHEAAKLVVQQGGFPETLDGLMALPGIGRSTAGAILSIAFNQPYPILDGNVKRVLARYLAIPGWPGQSRVSRQLWAASTKFTPTYRIADYTQAMMDLGATVCSRSRPACTACPLAQNCVAYQTNRIAEYPGTNAAKAMPVKQAVLLLLHNGEGNVLLEKRPPSGIWRGLWSLPEFADAETAIAWCAEKQFAFVKAFIGETRRHTFSHFHLDYTPLMVLATGTPNSVSETGVACWQTYQDLDRLGLPKPVKQLLQQHFKGELHEPLSQLR